jgi:hypothetical protein
VRAVGLTSAGHASAQHRSTTASGSRDAKSGARARFTGAPACVKSEQNVHGGPNACPKPAAPDDLCAAVRIRAGTVDYQRVLLNLHRKGLPLEVLKKKADDYVGEKLLTLHDATYSIKSIEAERGQERLINDPRDADADAAGNERGKISERLTLEEMQHELEKRIEMMRTGAGGDGVTDQFRVYQEVPLVRLFCCIPSRCVQTGAPSTYFPKHLSSTSSASWKGARSSCASWCRPRLGLESAELSPSCAC